MSTTWTPVTAGQPSVLIRWQNGETRMVHVAKSTKARAGVMPMAPMGQDGSRAGVISVISALAVWTSRQFAVHVEEGFSQLSRSPWHDVTKIWQPWIRTVTVPLIVRMPALWTPNRSAPPPRPSQERGPMSRTRPCPLREGARGRDLRRM